MCLTFEEKLAVLDLAPRAHGVVDWQWVRRELEEGWALEELWIGDVIRDMMEIEGVQ